MQTFSKLLKSRKLTILQPTKFKIIEQPKKGSLMKGFTSQQSYFFAR